MTLLPLPAKRGEGRGEGPPARLSFFNEQDEPELTELVNTSAVLKQLHALRAHVTMGLRDLSSARAHAVQRLCGEGVPVGAWLLLPREDGYFATYDNVTAVEARVEAVLRWAEQHRLAFGAIGFDFEPDLRELDALFRNPVRALAGWVRRAGDRPRRERALLAYRALITRLRSAGWSIEAYQFPLLLEDRAAGSHFFQRVSSSLDVAVEREVMMAYSSMLGPLGLGLVEGWTQGVRAVAVGSTGGGVDPLPKLTFDELSRDLRLAARACSDVSIFSLEGCVMNGHLPRLLDLDWAAPVSVPMHQRVGAASIRSSARAIARLFR